MILHEYQSKMRLSECGIPIPRGKIATTPQQAYQIAQEYDGVVAVKAQILAGGRGKVGGVRIAHTSEEARSHAQDILGTNLMGFVVQQVLVEQAVMPEAQFYLSITNDRATCQPVMMAAAGGGVGFETVIREKPEDIIREYIDPFMGLLSHQAVNLANTINLSRDYWRDFGQIAHKLYECYVKSDATLAEINPLVITDKGQLMALDSKLIVDDSALYRHKDLSAIREADIQSETEMRAREAGLTYIELGGHIGCMVNGAGLGMTTLDMTTLYGEGVVGPACLLDIGGGARAHQVAAGLRIIVSDSRVKTVLLNIFGGLTRCDEVAHGILRACQEVKPDVPIIVRLQGTNALEGQKIIEDANFENVCGAVTLTEAAQKAVAAAKGMIQS